MKLKVTTSKSSGCGFEPHRRHCVVSLSKTLYPLLSTGLTQKDLENVDWDVQNNKENNKKNKVTTDLLQY